MRAWIGIFIGLSIALGANRAEAFCRQRSCQDSKELSSEAEKGQTCERDARGCILEGDLLYYDSPCLSFAVAAGSGDVLGVDDERFEELVREAFNRWQTVDCGDGSEPRLQVQSAGVVETAEPVYCGLPELNLSVWFLQTQWPYESNALGYTTSTYAQDDAEVFDADVEINVQKLVDDGLTGLNVEDVLLSIFTHEAGHFLGLGHSDDPGSVMAASYSPRDLLSRPLTQDDVDGICAIYPPGKDFECSEPGVSEAALDEAACQQAIDDTSAADAGCNLTPWSSPRDRSTPLSLLSLLAAAVFFRCRRGSQAV
jgi:hypothetical protein